MNRKSTLFRVVATGLLAIVLVPILWGVMLFATPGVMVAHYVLPIGRGLGSLGSGMRTVAVVDFSVWFAGLWGIQILRSKLRDEGQERRRVSISLGATLLALPFSFYVAWGAYKVLNLGKLAESMFLFATTVALSIVSCATVICGLFVLVRGSKR